MANDWRLIGLILALVLIYAVCVAIWTRWTSNARLQGQTIYHVAAGVAGVVIIAGIRIGFENTAFLLVCFVVAGLPMAYEYFGRLQREESEARKVLEESYEHSAQIGKNEYKAAIVKCRNANREARGQLKRIVSETNSNLIRALVGNVLLALSENDEAIERLEEIGRNARHLNGSNRAPCPDTSRISSPEA